MLALVMVSFIFIRTLGLKRDKVYKVFPNLEDEGSEENGPLALLSVCDRVRTRLRLGLLLASMALMLLQDPFS